VAERYNIPHIAAGDLLREAVANETELGKSAKVYMTKGELVPDQIVIDLILERLTRPDAETGYILDGFPRTLPQAEKLSASEDVDVVINIEVSFDLLVERLTGRRSCPKCGSVYHIRYNPPKSEGTCDKCGSPLIQRADDKEEVIKNRLETYNRQTKPLIDFYRTQNKLKNIPGSGLIEDIFKDIVLTLDNMF
jgi:adenylate kinase